MMTCTLPRTGKDALVFQGEKIACVYGHWHYGIHWSKYHNLTVYRTQDGQYVVSIQYRTPLGDHLTAERPHDHAMIVRDTDALTEQLAGYDPLAYPPHDGHDPNYLKSRYWEQVRILLRLVQRVQEGERPPLYEPVVIEWGEIDDDVRDAFASAGAEEGISGHEWLRRSEERTMEEIGEGGARVVVVGADAPDGDVERLGTRFPPSPARCADCGTQDLSVSFTAPILGILLCQSCYEARQTREVRPH